MVALSVIVPFYDETAFLTDALRSVLTQGIADLEIIVVNDNPEKFSEHDIRPLVPTGPGEATITILSQPENRGLSAARNTGLDAAKGTFIAFLDADDYYTTTGLFDQFQMARDSQADLTHAQTYFTQKGSPALSLLPRDKLLFGTRKMVSGLGAAEEAHFIVSTWSSIYRHAFLKRNKLRFDPAQPKFEDRLFVVHCVTAASKIAFLGAPTRVWRQRAGSISVSETSPDIHRLQLQLLEKCMAHLRNETAAGTLPQRFEKRELFNTVSRLIWDLDLIRAIARGDDPSYGPMKQRVIDLLGSDSFSTAFFEDEVTRPISRVGRRTRKGFVRVVDFLALHKMLRDGDFDGFVALQDELRPKVESPDVIRPNGQHLVLHLGMHKTGSTFLQHQLALQAHRLAPEGWIFPRTGLGHGTTDVRDGALPGHQGLLRAARQGDSAVWDALFGEVRASRAETLLLSCENMLQPLAEDRDDVLAGLFHYFKGFESIRVVAFARRADHYLEAFYKESVSNGQRIGARSVQEFLVDYGKSLSDFPALFAPFEEMSGTPVTLIDFDAARAKGRILDAFRAATGLPKSLREMKVPTYPSPDRTTAHLLRMVNMIGASSDKRAAVMRGYFAAYPAALDRASLLSPEARIALLRGFGESSASFAAERGYAPDLAAMERELAAEDWSDIETIPMERLAGLLAAAARADEVQSSSGAPKASSSPVAPYFTGPKSGDAGTVLRIKLRPWVAKALRMIRR